MLKNKISISSKILILPIRLSPTPAGESVCGESRVNEGDVSDVQRIRQISIVLVELIGVELTLKIGMVAKLSAFIFGENQ